MATETATLAVVPRAPARRCQYGFFEKAPQAAEPEGAEHHVDGREVKGESDDAEHQEDERVCGRAGGIRQSHEHHVIHLAAPFLGRMDSM